MVAGDNYSTVTTESCLAKPQVGRTISATCLQELCWYAGQSEAQASTGECIHRCLHSTPRQAAFSCNCQATSTAVNAAVELTMAASAMREKRASMAWHLGTAVIQEVAMWCPMSSMATPRLMKMYPVVCLAHGILSTVHLHSYLASARCIQFSGFCRNNLEEYMQLNKKNVRLCTSPNGWKRDVLLPGAPSHGLC